MTGTLAASASRSTLACAKVRTTIAATELESARAVSATDSSRSSCSSSGRSMIGSMPSRCAAASNASGVRVEGLSNRQAIVAAFRGWLHQVGPFFISSARSSSAVSCVALRSAIRSRFDGVVVVDVAVMGFS